MPNNTETYWDADGESLHTYARSIETLGGMGPPPLRGENIVIPLSPGAVYVPKTPDQNTLHLAMWLRGVDPEAGSGVTQSSRALFQQNYNDLIRLLWKPGRQVELTKRFYDVGSSSPVAASAMVEYKGGLEPTMIGRSAGKCLVDLGVPGAYFYAVNPLTVPVVNGDNIISVPGNAPTLNVRIVINGSRTNTRVLNKNNGIQFTYPTAVLAGEYVDIYPQTFEARHKPASAVEYDVSTRIIHSGAPQWFQLEPGDNIVNISSDSGIGVVALEIRGAWV